MYDLLVRGGTVVTPTRTEALDVAVEGERIAAIEPPGALGAEAEKVIDATDCYVIPGGVDPHVHYSLGFPPVVAESQDFSPAAAYGGTTTLIDFALQEAPTSLHEAIENKKLEAAGRMAVDYGLHAICSGPEISFEVMDEVADVVRSGIPTIKSFTTYGWMTDDGHRWGLINKVAEAGGMSVIHAEDDAIAVWNTKRYLREGKTHGAYIAETRDALVEEAAVRRVMLLCERAGSPLYILHLAAGAGVLALAEGRAKGLPFYGETLAAYLSFTSDKLWDDENRGLLWNNYPTIKSQADQDLLWEAVADNRVQVVSADHYSLTSSDRYEKMGTTVDSLQAGQSSVELRIPVSFHLGVQEGRLGLNRFVELISTNPAKIMGLYPRKGALAVGSDADIVVIDPNRTWTVHWEDLHMIADFSCWEGWELRGKVTTTILRGAVLVENERFVGSTSGGQFVPRTLLPKLIAWPPDFSLTFESQQLKTAATPGRERA